MQPEFRRYQEQVLANAVEFAEEVKDLCRKFPVYALPANHYRINIMQCERCQETIAAGEDREHLGQRLCEDCYMDALSPAKACDPWAVHSAKTFEKEQGGVVQLTDRQKQILSVLDETGGIEPRMLTERLNISPADLEREIATLRHMEKVRAELRDGRKHIVLWKQKDQ